MSRAAHYDLLVAGEINPDLILTGEVLPEFGQVEKLVDSAQLTVGSSSAIFACGAARLGLRVVFMGMCGEDVFGRFMLEALSQAGVDISPVIVSPTGHTGLSVILNRQADRAILTYPGLIPALEARSISDRLLGSARHLHVASYFLQTSLQPGLPELFRRAHSLGVSTSLDPNWDPTGKWGGLDELLPFVDVFLLNENEALAISASVDLPAALDRLSQQAGVVVVKRGAQGASAMHTAETQHAPALQLPLVDTIGAGDSFDAGFLYGWLNQWSLPRSLALAVTCGSLSTRLAGGTAAQPSLPEALTYLKQAVGIKMPGCTSLPGTR